MSARIVFDTTTVLSALLFPAGRLVWLRKHWREGECTPLISQATAAELTRVLGYPKFGLSVKDRRELLGDYLPYCVVMEIGHTCNLLCRDPKDQPFLDLAESGNADVLVTGDEDLLVLAGQTRFRIESPEDYRRRFE